jgi:hypothetical protein
MSFSADLRKLQIGNHTFSHCGPQPLGRGARAADELTVADVQLFEIAGKRHRDVELACACEVLRHEKSPL